MRPNHPPPMPAQSPNSVFALNPLLVRRLHSAAFGDWGDGSNGDTVAKIDAFLRERLDRASYLAYFRLVRRAAHETAFSDIVTQGN